MRLLVTTPTVVIADLPDVVSLTAEDASGRFGVLGRHADFLTVLAPSVVSWRRADGEEGHCAVRGGVFTVEHGDQVSIATREAIVSGDLEQLEREVVAHYARGAEEERAARVEASMLRIKAIRRLVHYLRAPGGAGLSDLP